jgi:hypothetical protein
LCYHKKKILFPSSFWGIFDFFCLFQYFESLKKNKIMLRYKGGTSAASILVPSAMSILMIRARRHVQGKDTRENSSMGQGVKTQRQSATRLAYKACFKGLVQRNMEPTLGQRHRNANVMIHMDISGHPPFPTGSKQFSDNFGNLLFLVVLTSGAILRA